VQPRRGKAGSTVSIVKNGQTIATYTSPKAFATVVYSSPDVTAGSYTIAVDGASVATVTNNVALAGGMGGQRR
jgi:hypothetical protein